MGTITKKISSVVLSATTALWLTGSGAILPIAHGATVAELQTQIQALLTQIQALQAQLGTATGGAVAAYNYTRNLTVGSKGDDVTALQNLLISKGHLKIAAATGYFGSLTKAALAAYQAANGISPAVGYFGSITRAKVTSEAAAAPAPVTPVTPTVAGTGLTVTLAANQPASGLFGESFASRPFTKLAFTASADGDITVKTLTIERSGQAQDAVFSGVVALDEDGIRLGDSKTIGSDHRTKLTDSFVVKAGQTRILTIAGDSDTDQNDYNGQLASLGLVAVDAGTAAVNAAYPLIGNQMTVNSTLAIGSLTLERGSLDPGTNITKEIGTKNYTFASLKMTSGSNEDVKVKSVRWYQSGSAASSDLANIKVYVDGVGYDTTVSSDGKYYTAKLGDGIKIDKGSNKEATIKGDIISGSNRGVDFDLYRYADIQVYGLTYNYDILPSATEVANESATDDDGTFQAANPKFDAYEVTIGAGSVSAEKATAIGAANVAENLADQILGGFVADVKGEEVSVAAMNFDVSTVDGAGTGNDIDSDDITSITLVRDDGQVVAGPVNGVAGGDNAVRFTDTITLKVGRQTYTLKGKLGTAFDSNDQVAASTTPSSDWTTVKGVTTSQTITPSGGTVTMSTMTVKAGDLTVKIASDTASSSPNQNVVLGTGSYPFAKYVLDASNSGEDIRVTQMVLDLTTSYPANTADELTNCQLFDGSTALNTGTNVLNPSNDDAAGADKTFTFDSGLVIPKGTVKTLTIKCNLTAGGTTEFVGWGLVDAVGTIISSGITSGVSLIETITANNGRTVVAQSAGTLTLSLDSSSPSLKLIQSGSTDNTLTVLRLDALYEDVRLEQLGLQLATSTASSQENASNSPSDLTKVTLWDGATKIGEVVFTGDYATATLSNFVIPKETQKLLTIKGDIAPIGVDLSQANPGHLIRVEYDANWGDNPDDTNEATNIGGKAVGVSSGTNIYTAGTDSASNGARIVRAIPTLTKQALSSAKFTNSSDQILYRFKIAAPAGTNGIGLYKFTFNLATSTTSDVEYPTNDTANAAYPAHGFQVQNLKVYCYSDSGYSQGSCGNSSGLLNQYTLAVADDAAATTDFEDGTISTDPDVDAAIYFNPTASSGDNRASISIPAGDTRYFELRADISGASSTPTISVKLLGDAGWQATQCAADTVALTVDVCDWADSAGDRVSEAGETPASTFAGVASTIDDQSDDEDFIWSDNATNTTQSQNSYDWFNGNIVPGIPSESTASEVLTF